MHNLIAAYPGSGAIPELPKSARTRLGVEFNPRADRWPIETVHAISA